MRFKNSGTLNALFVFIVDRHLEIQHSIWKTVNLIARETGIRSLLRNVQIAGSLLRLEIDG